MSFEIRGSHKRVNESRYPGRIRETSMSEERSDDKRRLAEQEEFIRKHKKERQEPPDRLELRKDSAKHPDKGKERRDKPPAWTPPQRADDEPRHLDIIV